MTEVENQELLKETNKVYSSSPENITVLEGRQRREFSSKEIRRLADSIKDKGQKSPGVCCKDGDKLILVFGERRLRACSLLGQEFLFMLEHETDPIILEEIQLEENTHRVDLSWLEQNNAIRKLHALKQEQKGVAGKGRTGGHGIKDTAELVNFSPSKVSQAIELSVFAESYDEVKEASTEAEAKKIVKRLNENFIRKQRLDEATERIQEKEKTEKVEVTAESMLDTQLEEYKKHLINGTMEDILPTFPDESFDIVFFDPPWGVDYDRMARDRANKNAINDEAMTAQEFEIFLLNQFKLIYSKMATHSHLYVFFPITRIQVVYDALEATGFQVSRIPTIWHKKGAHTQRQTDLEPGRSYEPIAYARKGKKVLAEKGVADMIITPMMTAKLKQSHPTAKHPDLYLKLLQRSAMPGDKVLDPMIGSGMLGVAIEVLQRELALEWTGIEMSEDHCNLALANLVMGYHNLLNDKTAFTFPKKEKGDFKELIPSTPEWSKHWRSFPEDQEDMLEFAKTYYEENEK